MKIIQVLSKFRNVFNTSIYLRYQIQQLEEVKKLLKAVNAKKAQNWLNQLQGFQLHHLPKTINNSILKGVFPNEAKIALVSPLDKKSPVSILPTFSKIFGKFIKNYLMKVSLSFVSVSFKVSASLSFVSHLSVYRASYSTQHVLLRLIEEWKINLDNNLVVGTILMDFSKAFDCIPDELLIAKHAASGREKKLYFIFIHTSKIGNSG